MRATFALAVGLAAATLAASPLRADETAPNPFGTAVPAETLDNLRGGTAIVDSVIQGNSTSQTSANTGNVSVGANAVKLSGTNYAANVTGNSGMVTVIQNTGDLVNMSNATSINVYLH